MEPGNRKRALKTIGLHQLDTKKPRFGRGFLVISTKAQFMRNESSQWITYCERDYSGVIYAEPLCCGASSPWRLSGQWQEQQPYRLIRLRFCRRIQSPRELFLSLCVHASAGWRCVNDAFQPDVHAYVLINC